MQRVGRERREEDEEDEEDEDEDEDEDREEVDNPNNIRRCLSHGTIERCRSRG